MQDQRATASARLSTAKKTLTELQVELETYGACDPASLRRNVEPECSREKQRYVTQVKYRFALRLPLILFFLNCYRIVTD